MDGIMTEQPKPEMPTMDLAEIKKDAERAYCRYIDILDQNCRGIEYKVENKLIDYAFIENYGNAQEKLGFH